MATDKKVTLTKKAVKNALATTSTYHKWKLAVDEGRRRRLGLTAKMLFVIQGLRIGVTLETALDIAGVSKEEYKQWRKDPMHADLIRHAMASAEGILEHIVYEHAKQDPRFALQVLIKRNPKRWNKRAPMENKNKSDNSKKTFLPVVNVGSFLSAKKKSDGTEPDEIVESKKVLKSMKNLDINVSADDSAE